jgi:hypothetical protein
MKIKYIQFVVGEDLHNALKAAKPENTSWTEFLTMMYNKYVGV